MKFIGIIPARFASTRFPGKPLAMLGDKPVIQHVYEKVSAALEEAYVATDDTRIYDAVVAFGGKVVMTRSDHRAAQTVLRKLLRKLAATGMSSSTYRVTNRLLLKVSSIPSAIVLTMRLPRLQPLANHLQAWMQ